ATPERTADLAHNHATIAQAIASAASTHGRPLTFDAPGSVRLVAVSKTRPLSDILAMHSATGQRHFGENYVQELVDKAERAHALLGEHNDLRWHFIGHLQTNKAKAIAQLVPRGLWVVETLDSAKLARELQKHLARLFPDSAPENDRLRVFLQVNTSSEPSKAGVADFPALLDLARVVVDECPRLLVAGLMTIGEPGQGARDFALLSDWAARIAADVPSGIANSLELSMGMSDDFAHAIECGSTNVRVGSALFGAR
ncbi:hypothetical protein BC828DRAFT_339640, partial [Blastocladiella britannica]